MDGLGMQLSGKQCDWHPPEAFSATQASLASQVNQSHGLYDQLPCLRSLPAPTPRSGFKKTASAGTSSGDLREMISPNTEPESNLKRFLVFDHSGDQTTLVYSSLIGNPVRPQIDRNPEHRVAAPGAKYPDDQWGAILTDGSDQKHGADEESGLHEDTEELNALLYSDEDTDGDDGEEDEVTSTGHSPVNGSPAEGVASSDGSRKRGRGEVDLPASIVDTASSGCAGGFNKFAYFEGNEKRARVGRIWEMVRVVEGVIPGVEGKGAVAVLEEAIHYLKALKHRTVELGLEAAL